MVKRKPWRLEPILGPIVPRVLSEPPLLMRG
jgi:hypothetical protein